MQLFVGFEMQGHKYFCKGKIINNNILKRTVFPRNCNFAGYKIFYEALQL